MNKRISNMKKSKFVIALLVFCFMLSIVPLKGLKVQAAENTTYNKIRVRVEGLQSTLFDKEFGTEVQGVTALDLLKAAVGSDKVVGSDSEWGFFINEILGEKPTANNGWMFYAENGTKLEVSAPVDKLNIKDSAGNYNYSEIVFYMSYYTNTLSTKIPSITISSTDDNNEILVKDLWSGEALANADITIQNVGTLTTDANGKVNFKVPQGTYRISFGKRGTYIEVAPVIYTVELPVGNVNGGGNTNPDTVIADKKAAVKSTLDLNKTYYSTAQSLKFRTVLSLFHTSDCINADMANIVSKFKVSKQEKAASYTANIFALTALGKDPNNYDGVNYVKKLLDAQRQDGMFVVENGDDMWPTTQAYCVLALDMAGANYNVEGAMKSLVSMAKNGHYDDVDTTAMVITALANHKNSAGVNEIINSSLKYLKDNQLSTGGFEAWGAENPYSISSVIQALVANGVDVFSSEWTKNGNTMVDALFTYRVDNHFRYTASWGTDEAMATEQAFAALADVYRGKSIYQTLKLAVAEETTTATTTTTTTTTEAEKNVLPKTGSALDLNILMAVAIMFIASGVYVVRKTSKNI